MNSTHAPRNHLASINDQPTAVGLLGGLKRAERPPRRRRDDRLGRSARAPGGEPPVRRLLAIMPASDYREVYH